MKLNRFKLSWDDTASTAKLAIGTSFLLAIAVCGLSIKLVSDHERDVLVPPQLTERAEVAWDSASASYYKSWGLFIAATLGSVTPRTAAFIAQQLEPFFDAPIWPKIAVQILSIADDPNYAHNGTLNVFTPRSVDWEPSTKKVFVSGMLDTTAYRNSPLPVAEIVVTYEMRFTMRSGVPKATYFNSYIGDPRTQKWLSNHQGDPSLTRKPANGQTSIIPQESDIHAQIEKAQIAEMASEAAIASAAAASQAASSKAPAPASGGSTQNGGAGVPAAASNPGGSL